MKKSFHLLLVTILALGLSLGLAGCKQEEETLGEKVEEATDEAGDKMEEMGDEIGDSMEEATDDAADAMDDMTDNLEDEGGGH